MKNKKVILGIILAVILIVTSIIVLITVFKKKEKVDLKNILDAKSYSVDLKYYEDFFNNGSYTLDEEMHYEFDFINDYEYMEFSNNKFYNYKGKQIFSEEKEFGEDELVWFYYEPKTNYFISFPGSDNKNYKQTFSNLIEILSNLEYSKKGNIYVTNSNIDEKINEYLSEIVFDIGSGSIGDIKYTDVVDKIEIITEKNTIKQINFYIVMSCADEYPDICNYGNQKLELYFDEVDEKNYELPLDVQKSLEETTAGDWVGTYSNEVACADCSKDKKFKNELILTDKFENVNGRGWELKYSLYDGQYKNSGTENYYFEGTNLYIVDIFGEIEMKGHIQDNKIELYDDNGKVKYILIKE